MNTYNWDVVYAASAEALNSLLKLNSSTISFSDFTSVRYSSEINFDIKVSFKELQIISGGSNKFIVLELKTDGNINKGKYIYKKLVSRVRIALEFFKTGNFMGKIRLNCKPDTIQFVDMDVNHIFPADQLTALSVLDKVYTEMIVKHADKFSYTFAELMCLNNTLIGMKQFDYSWYQPAGNGNVGFLAVLGVMDDRDISKYSRAVDHELLFDSDGLQYDSVFLAAENQFLKSSMLPALKNIFPLSQQDSFVIADDSIKNNGIISLSQFAVGSTFYQPYIDCFDFHIDDDKLVTNLSGRCPITDLPDSYVDFMLSAKNRVEYNSSLNRIEFVPDPNITVTANQNIPSYVKWIEILSLNTLNLIIDSVSDSISKCIKNQLANYSLCSAAIGVTSVGWAINILMNEGGISDNLYLRGKRIFN